MQLKVSFTEKSSDPLRQYVLGRREASCGFVLKVKRRRVGESFAKHDDAELVGSYCDAYQFSQLSDLQFVPERVQFGQDTTRHLHVSSSVAEALPRPFQRPPAISKVAQVGTSSLWSIDQVAEASMHSEDSATAAVTTTRAKPVNKNVVVKWGEEIPQKSNLTLGAKKTSDEKSKMLKDVVVKLFSKRPIWRKRQLENNNEADRCGAGVLNEVLPEVAFNFATGPFKGLWCRFAFDPAQDASTRFLQLFAVRFNIAVYRQISQMLVAHIGSSVLETHVVNLDTMTLDRVQTQLSEGLKLSKTTATFSIFNTLIREMAQFQLCSLTDDDLFSFLSQTLHLSTCDGPSGWYSEDTMRYLRAKVVQTVFKRAEQFCSKPALVRVDATLPPSLLRRSLPKQKGSLPKVAHEYQKSEDAQEVADDLGFPADFFTWQDKYFSIPDRVGNPTEIAQNCKLLLSLIEPRFRDVINDVSRKQKKSNPDALRSKARPKLSAIASLGAADEASLALNIALGAADEEVEAYENFQEKESDEDGFNSDQSF